ncbi:MULTISPECIES: DUF4230 domain-containing protein [Clostridium]|nr:DUF4230 domain-containing protein [Clostridium sp.]RKI45698.1 DUF4230 domain-containing protein [Clostridium paraputrificum]MBS6889706.1 DUF4230 domain-containing protein [Clostridium sp.]MDU1228443.1 DUF4230 domain-containing protein [Clostridium sp.]MDU1843381.1 DUF4230 domain-containing protein [Clostridium sp.]MDU3109261.1 DUF4230 domain-containing protein [Clostridium sp.]
MKLLKKNKQKNSLLIPCILIFLGIFIGYTIFLLPSKSKKQWTLPDASGTGVKYLTEESIINNINETNLLIPLELELSETITVDDSWGDFSIFEKYKEITYFADCSYMIDLSKISSSDLKMNSTTRDVELNISAPTVYSVNINHNKTIYEEAVTGLLRFGDIELNAEEYGVIEREVKKRFTNKMNSKDLYDRACSSSNIALEKFLKTILGEDIKTTFIYK